MSQTYKSYGFYDMNNSDSDENTKNPGKPSRLAQKQEKKKNEKLRKQKDSDSESEEEQKQAPQVSLGPGRDTESEFAPKNAKKVKQETQSNKAKGQDSKKKIERVQDNSSNIVPRPQDQNSNVNIQNKETNKATNPNAQSGIKENNIKKGGLTPPVSASQNSSLQTIAVGASSEEKMIIESDKVEESKLEGNNNSLLGNSNNESFTEMVSGQDYSGNILPTNLLNQNILNSNSQTPLVKKTNEAANLESSATQLDESMISQTVSIIPLEESNMNDSLMKDDEALIKSIREKRENREGLQVVKKKSGKYQESSSSESSPSPKKASPPKVQSKTLPSVENRQKSKLSSHLKSIRESMKNQEQNDPDLDINIAGVSAGKPKFFVDTTPLGIIEEEGENKKLVPQTTEMETEDRQYRILGQERAFRTQGKNLLEKLNKFFVQKEEDKKEEEKIETKDDEDMKEIEDEFNFESRYFMYNPTKVCNRCKKAGHFERWCPEDITIRCLFCVGHHRTDHCTQVVCFQCYGVGHRARDCDAPGSLMCFRCGKKGHKSSQCGMIVLKEATLGKEKREESGDIKCINCGRYGHAKCGRESNSGRKGNEVDHLYKEKQRERQREREREREETNMKILSRARDAEKYEFEGSLSNESFEDLNNFEIPSRSNYAKKSRREREEEVLKEIKREKSERHREKDRKRKDKDRERERYSQKKKSKRYYNN